MMMIHLLGVTKNVSVQYKFLFKTVESATPDLNVMECSCHCPLESLGFVGDPTKKMCWTNGMRGGGGGGGSRSAF